jgi:hypothetical protein
MIGSAKTSAGVAPAALPLTEHMTQDNQLSELEDVKENVVSPVASYDYCFADAATDLIGYRSNMPKVAPTFGVLDEWGVYVMREELNELAVDDIVLYSGGGGTKYKVNPKRKGEMVGARCGCCV